jgi:hypothetical protein
MKNKQSTKVSNAQKKNFPRSRLSGVHITSFQPAKRQRDQAAILPLFEKQQQQQQSCSAALAASLTYMEFRPRQRSRSGFTSRHQRLQGSRISSQSSADCKSVKFQLLLVGYRTVVMYATCLPHTLNWAAEQTVSLVNTKIGFYLSFLVTSNGNDRKPCPQYGHLAGC